MKHFPLLYRLNAEEGYLIWISNESDSVVVDPEGFVLTFKDADAVQAYADLKHYKLEAGEPILHDLDWVGTWLQTPGMPVNCVEALNAWNLFSDVARSIRARGTAFERLDSRFPRIYQKLFWGNNLPALTPEGKHFDPQWPPDELSALTEVLGAGLELFQSFTRSFQQNS